MNSPKRFSVVSGNSEGQKYHDRMVAEQLAKERAQWLRDSYSTKSPSDAEMVARILALGTPAEKGQLATLLDVKDGKIHISGNSLEELQSKRDIIIRLYDQTYTPSNGLQAYGQDPNMSGIRDPNKAPSGWRDPNGRRS